MCLYLSEIDFPSIPIDTTGVYIAVWIYDCIERKKYPYDEEISQDIARKDDSVCPGGYAIHAVVKRCVMSLLQIIGILSVGILGQLECYGKRCSFYFEKDL